MDSFKRSDELGQTQSLRTHVTLDEIQFIVDTLNRPPFQEKLTLFSFDGLSQIELLQLVNHVFAEIDPKQKRDLRDEQQDEYAKRMIEFLFVLNYRVPLPDTAEFMDFKESFVKGAKDVVHPLLYWMLNKLSDLKKRAYLSRFLRTVDVPEEFFADPIVVSLYQEYKEKQAEFKEVHKVCDKLRQSSSKPSELKAEITQLEAEREQLNNKLAKLKDKVSSPEYAHVSFDAILDATHRLRKEQEEESKLYNQLREQNQRSKRSEQILRQATTKYRELEQSNINNTDPKELLKKLRDEVSQSRAYCNDRLEKELKEKERAVRDLEKMFTSEPMPENDVEDIAREVDQLQGEVEELLRQRDKLAASMDSKIKMYRDRVDTIQQKRDDLQEKLKEVEVERKDKEDELQRISTDHKKLMSSGIKPMNDAQIKQYMKNLSKRTTQVKTMKDELEAVKDEVEVLARTEEILRSRNDNIQQFNADLEKEKGVSGFGQVQDNLEQVSSQKAELDSQKGVTLQAMSKMVEKMTNMVKEKRNKLYPLIKDFKTIRDEAETVEKEYTEKKKVYDSLVSSIESERSKLQEDVQSLQTSVQEDETTTHFFNCLSSVTQVRLDQMTQEAAYLAGEAKFPDANFKSYTDVLNRMITDQEISTKTLRLEKKTITENHKDNTEQRAMFKNIKQILEVKYKTLQDHIQRMRTTDTQNYSQGMVHDEANVMILSE